MAEEWVAGHGLLLVHVVNQLLKGVFLNQNKVTEIELGLYSDGVWSMMQRKKSVSSPLPVLRAGLGVR